jgi:hypothetical protein
MTAHIVCPACEAALDWSNVHTRSVFYAFGGYKEPCIVFDCERCSSRVYFRVFGNQIETGLLGASPVFDPIPCACVTHNTDLSMKINGAMDELIVTHQAGTRTLPIARKYRSPNA